MRPLKVGILGQGRSGRNIHGQYLSSVPEQYAITVVADPLAARTDRAREEYGCEAVNDYRLLLEREDLDLVVNATPSHLHVPITLEFLRNGFNVLCEKPLARRAADVDRLIQAADEAGVTLAVFQQSRYAPYFQQVRQVLDSGVLGRIIQISIAFNGFGRRWDWQTLQECSGGSLLNTGPHPLDQALQLFGTDTMPEITCRMDRVNTFGDAEDYVKVILQGPGRPLVDLEVSSCCAYPSFTYCIHAEYGGLRGTQQHIDWKYYKPAEAPERELIRSPIETAEGIPAYCRESLTWHEESWDVPPKESDLFISAGRAFYDMLYAALTENAPLEITPQQVRQQIAVIEECHRQNPLV